MRFQACVPCVTVLCPMVKYPSHERELFRFVKLNRSMGLQSGRKQAKYSEATLIPSSLDAALLVRILNRLGAARGSEHFTETRELFDLVPHLSDKKEACRYLQRHTKFLRDCDLIHRGTPIPEYCIEYISLTSKGEMFIQPELANFSNQELWPEVMKALEDSVQVLSYPDEEKQNMLFRLRDALAKQVPDVIAKVIVEIGSKIASGSA